MKFHKGLLDIFILSMLWGPSFLFVKLAVGSIDPLTLVALRISLGALLLYTVMWFRGIRLKGHYKLIPHCLFLGVFAQSLPFICFNYSLQTIPSSLSALINGSTPVLTILLANLFIKDEKLSWNRVIGILMGLSGFFVLFLPPLLGKNDHGLHLPGMLLSFIGASCYAIGMVYARVFLKNSPPLVVPMLQLLTSLIYLIPLALIVESPLDTLPHAPLKVWLSVLGLGLLGTMLAYIMYYRIIAKQGATAVSMVAYLLPIVGTLFGVIFLKEHIGIHFCIAAALILCGVLVVNGVFAKAKKKEVVIN